MLHEKQFDGAPKNPPAHGTSGHELEERVLRGDLHFCWLRSESGRVMLGLERGFRGKRNCDFDEI
jgi:hypothetical protein